MRSVRHPRFRSGFTLFELLVVIAVISIIATMATPNLLRLMQRSKLTGMAQQTSVLMRLARQESIRNNVPTVVRLDQANDTVIAFVDVDGVNLGDPPDSIFNPIVGQPHMSTDWELDRYTLPARIDFAAPAADPEPCGPVVVCDFTPVAGENVAVFNPNGSALNEGAFRLADPYQNYLEIRVAPAATGRIVVRKFDDVDVAWYLRNEAGKPWEWH